MTGEIGVAGDLATGMLVARAVEPHAGEPGHGAQAHGLCLNCGTALHGAFCHVCGQSGHVHRTLVSIGHDLLHGVFHFEGKVWRTLPMLVLHPGELTRRYIAGERARFVSPLALFLFSVFLMFAVIHSNIGDFEIPQMRSKDRIASIAAIDRQIAQAERTLASAQRTRPAGSRTVEQDAAKVETLKAAREALASANPLAHATTRWHALDKGLAKAVANPGLAVYKLQSSAYKYSWGLIPISVPLVALLFLWRRRFKLYDHAIFVTYSLSFMMFLIVTMSLGLMIAAPAWLLAMLLSFAPPVHMFYQLRGAYNLRKRSALWRTAALLMMAWTALTLFITLLLVMGLME